MPFVNAGLRERPGISARRKTEGAPIRSTISLKGFTVIRDHIE
jgi:hypothetical protein